MDIYEIAECYDAKALAEDYLRSIRLEQRAKQEFDSFCKNNSDRESTQYLERLVDYLGEKCDNEFRQEKILQFVPVKHIPGADNKAVDNAYWDWALSTVGLKWCEDSEKKEAMKETSKGLFLEYVTVLLQSLNANIDAYNHVTQSPHWKSRCIYFFDRGLELPPTDQKTRHLRAQKYLDKVPPDFEKALMLFDPELDKNDSSWLLTVGYIYNIPHDNQHFNPVKALEFFKKSSALGNHGASMNIGMKYHMGHEGSIDLDEALKWYELAAKQNYTGAYGWMGDIKLFKLSLDNSSLDINPNEEIANLFFEGSKYQDMFSMTFYARCLLNGTGCHKSKEEGIDLYEKILRRIPKDHEKVIYSNVAYIMAARNFLGLDCYTNTTQARKYLNLILENSNHAKEAHVIIPRKVSLINMINRYEAEPEIRKAFDAAKSILRVMEMELMVKPTKELLEVLSVVRNISEAEIWPTKSRWKNIYEQVQAHMVGTSFEEATKSTLLSGPRYTPIDHNGLPIVGVWEEAAASSDEALQQRITEGSFVPQAGTSYFKGLSAHTENGISFHTEETANLPAMLLPQDFDVVMTLCFAHPDYVLWPSVSLEDVEDKRIHIDKHLLQRKVFSPEWLGYTDFGKTLFTTDQLIGNWAERSETYTSGTSEETYMPQAGELAKAFVKYVRLTGGRSGKGGSSRVMLRPEKVDNHIYGTAQGENILIHVDVADLKMRVDGSYILVEGEDENRLIALNDETFERGRVCQKLTDNYNFIAQLDPRFERARQMMRLLHAVADLREKTNYRLPRHLQDHFSKKLEDYQAMGELPQSQLICRRIPFMR